MSPTSSPLLSKASRQQPKALRFENQAHGFVSSNPLISRCTIRFKSHAVFYLTLKEGGLPFWHPTGLPYPSGSLCILMATNGGDQTPRHHGPHGHHLRKLLHPSGKRIHIAATPDEHDRLRKTLGHAEPDENFDVYIHGSKEHKDIVREIHDHHEQRRHHLRTKHGEVYDEFEHVRDQLDILSEEMHMLTDHGVSLDANFSKFGYDARIRTRDPGSDTSSMVSSEKRDWDAERKKGTAIKFWRKPVVRQYFHKGLLWRASQVEEVASFELFVDLLYVGIIAVIGDTAAEDPTAFGLLRFAITFILGWKMWSDITVIISWFEVDDIFQRICILFVMITLFGFTLNIVEAFETTWIMMISFYLASRFFGAVYYFWMGYMLPMIRGHMFVNAFLVLIPGALWIASIQVEYPSRLALIWPAIVLDLFGAVVVIVLKRRYIDKPDDDKGQLACQLTRWFEFMPATNIEHKTERTNAFVTLVFGYSVVALLFQNRAEFGINAFFGKAILGLIQAFAFNWLYFEIDAWDLHTHAIRRHVVSSIAWIFAHLPFIMAYVLAGASLSRLVLATDCEDADAENLVESWAARAEHTHEIPIGLRWFYCVGLGVALISMSAISLAHVHKTFEGQRLKKMYRLPVRVSIAIVIICLPLAEDRLSSLGLVATTTCLVVFVLAMDVYGATDSNDPFWRCQKSCQYSAELAIQKKAIVEALKRGETVELKMDENEKGEKVLHES
ncbi:uncharacterized protein KY384_006974 [Bacidia gigantensis]|uniref:uncharacterized protein n=1 Tax=Bacidia gigantensis TaxID=2732470 RepID=UPI001D040039|nr:uncharacterized protein KY384_006974 [Bacidia gigantensis]KAG8528058.1 hypothetical protein KY384_006974 [Bacidia gigantensis]